MWQSGLSKALVASAVAFASWGCASSHDQAGTAAPGSHAPASEDSHSIPSVGVDSSSADGGGSFDTDSTKTDIECEPYCDTADVDAGRDVDSIRHREDDIADADATDAPDHGEDGLDVVDDVPEPRDSRRASDTDVSDGQSEDGDSGTGTAPSCEYLQAEAPPFLACPGDTFGSIELLPFQTHMTYAQKTGCGDPNPLIQSCDVLLALTDATACTTYPGDGGRISYGSKLSAISAPETYLAAPSHYDIFFSVISFDYEELDQCMPVRAEWKADKDPKAIGAVYIRIRASGEVSSGITAPIYNHYAVGGYARARTIINDLTATSSQFAGCTRVDFADLEWEHHDDTGKKVDLGPSFTMPTEGFAYLQFRGDEVLCREVTGNLSAPTCFDAIGPTSVNYDVDPLTCIEQADGIFDELLSTAD